MKILIGGIVGGLVLFAWSAVSWMVLPWHNNTFRTFTHEQSVEAILTADAPTAGIYILKNKPSAFLVFNPQGYGPMKFKLMYDLLFDMLSAALVSYIVLRLKKSNYFSRLIVILVFALAVGILWHLSNWNWWGFSASFTLIGIADLIIGWFLAGLVLAKIASDS